MEDYSATIHCPVTPTRAYHAITQDMTHWWTPMTATFDKPGDQAKTGFGGDAYWIFEAQTFEPPTRIELKCVASQMLVDGLDEEGCDIVFTHHGLTPHMACFDICRAGWDHYIPGSLKDYLDGKPGQPNSY